MEWHDGASRAAGGRRPGVVPGRRIAGALGGALWWWAALRLTLEPQAAGTVEGAVVMGGWGLSLLPVHCVPWVGRGKGAAGWLGEKFGEKAKVAGAVVARAWRRRRDN
ncbi:hypothetical protein [Streptomyces gilvosporeus]|uniref:Uncharacterized protein n=1 Tax=Streptomyces gilvosporeus TaxID=553510 RepID=A0A1V0TXY1_9ACTN|nr:hypothetical protein [Streptomyces gilvosporeus]ARF57761.1 hypothetical protein B1H19_29395 [Streptomyces gilvosporeus]